VIGMAEVFELQPSATKRFADDYLRTFARLLDPDLAPAIRFSEKPAGEDITRWSLGQIVAFATIVSAGLWTFVAVIIYFCA